MWAQGRVGGSIDHFKIRGLTVIRVGNVFAASKSMGISPGD